MLASRLRRLAAAVLFGAVVAGASGACGGAKFTVVDDDAGAGDDAAVDSGDAMAQDGSADGSDASFCAMHPGHLLCDDFDTRLIGDPKGNMLWDNFTVSSATDGVINAAASVSPPRSFLASTTRPVMTGTTEELVFLTKDVGHAKTVALQFDVMVEAYGGGGTNAVILLNIQFGSLGYDLVAVSPTALTLLETLNAGDGGPGMTTSHPTSAALPAGMWTHVTVLLNLPQVAAQGNAVITLGGQTTLQSPLTYATPTSSGGTVSFGLLVTAAPSIWKIRYDNILIDKSS